MSLFLGELELGLRLLRLRHRRHRRCHLLLRHHSLEELM
jgi:hypothetical protein